MSSQKIKSTMVVGGYTWKTYVGLNQIKATTASEGFCGYFCIARRFAYEFDSTPDPDLTMRGMIFEDGGEWPFRNRTKTTLWKSKEVIRWSKRRLRDYEWENGTPKITLYKETDIPENLETSIFAMMELFHWRVRVCGMKIGK